VVVEVAVEVVAVVVGMVEMFAFEVDRGQILETMILTGSLALSFLDLESYWVLLESDVALRGLLRQS
jgi:hypothetical protein